MPTKKPGRHRNGQKVGDEAEPERAAANEDEPDHEAERRRGCGVMGRSRRRKHGQRAGENGRNGRIRADRKPPAGAEESKADRPGQQSEKADPRRQPGEAGGRHLLEGMAMAASVRPATASAPKSLTRQPAKDRKITHGRGAFGGRGGGFLAWLRHLDPRPSTAEPLSIV